MYKILRGLGRRGRKAGESHHITVEQFREHFKGVTRERFEEDPEVLEAAVEAARDLRGEARAVEANDYLNMTPEPEEIVEAMKEVQESAPGLDGVRISYIREAEAGVRGRVCGASEKDVRGGGGAVGCKSEGGGHGPVVQKGGQRGQEQL